jgi:hypothetical protein
MGVMYRVTATTGGWRSIPWPFAQLDLDDQAISIRSAHWGWWAEDRQLKRETLDAIKCRRWLGARSFRITIRGEPGSIRIQAPWHGRQIAEDLRALGYAVSGC